MPRTEFAVGWWQRLGEAYLQTSEFSAPLSLVVEVDGTAAVSVRMWSTFLGPVDGVGPEYEGRWNWRVRYNGSIAGTHETSYVPIQGPPRDTNWPAYRMQVLVACSTWDGAAFASDGSVTLLENDVAIVTATGLSIPCYSATNEVLIKHAPVQDSGRLFCRMGATAVSTDADGYPDQSGLTLYDDFSGGLGAWTAWAAGGGAATLPLAYSSGGPGAGYCISAYNYAPSSEDVTNNGSRGIQQTVTLVQPITPPSLPRPIPSATPVAPQARCTPQTAVGDGGIGPDPVRYWTATPSGATRW